MPYQLTTPTSDQVGVLHLGQAPCFVNYTGVNTTGTTTYNIVNTSQVPSGYQAVVLSLAISTASAAGITAQLQDTESAPIVSGTFALPAQGNVILPETPRGWFAGGQSAGINVVTNTANQNVGVTAAWTLFKPAS